MMNLKTWQSPIVSWREKAWLTVSGQLSTRHPERTDRFFMSRSRSPELVGLDDIMEFDLDCNPIDQRGRTMYGERPIHGAIYQCRPDVDSVVHNHAHEVILYSVTKVPMRQVIHTAGGMGRKVPVWDIREFGDTDLLVRTLEQGPQYPTHRPGSRIFGVDTPSGKEFGRDRKILAHSSNTAASSVIR